MSGQFWLGFVTPFLLAGTGWLAWKVFEFLSRFGDDSVRCVYCQRTTA